MSVLGATDTRPKVLRQKLPMLLVRAKPGVGLLVVVTGASAAFPFSCEGFSVKGISIQGFTCRDVSVGLVGRMKCLSWMQGNLPIVCVCVYVRMRACVCACLCVLMLWIPSGSLLAFWRVVDMVAGLDNEYRRTQHACSK